MGKKFKGGLMRNWDVWYIGMSPIPWAGVLG